MLKQEFPTLQPVVEANWVGTNLTGKKGYWEFVVTIHADPGADTAPVKLEVSK
jgi:hypothetical protein